MMALSINKVEALKSSNNNTSFEALEAGTYDAVLSAVVDLEHQINDFDKDNPKVEHQVKFLFEVPEKTYEVDGVALPYLLSRTVQLSSGERSNFFKLMCALSKKQLTQDAVLDMINSETAVKNMLGKALVLQVDTYKTKHLDGNNQPIHRNKITGFSSLRASLAQPQPVREVFMFEVANPDINIFKEKLSKWTRDTIMTAQNSEEFPAELHKAYRDVREAEENAKANK